MSRAGAASLLPGATGCGPVQSLQRSPEVIWPVVLNGSEHVVASGFSRILSRAERTREQQRGREARTGHPEPQSTSMTFGASQVTARSKLHRLR